MKYLLIFLLIFSLIISTGCSVRTYYIMNIDLLSFFEEDNIKTLFIVLTSEDICIYLLPAFQIILFNEEPNQEMRLGYHVITDFPDTPGNGEYTITITFKVVVKNLTLAAIASGGIAKIYLSGENATSIYNQGEVVFSIIISEVNPGEFAEIDIFMEIDSTSKYYSSIEQGSFRIGIKNIISSHDTLDLEMEYILKTLVLQISARPFSFIP